MLSQIRQKKKKEAVRRLSQGSGAAGYPHDHASALSSQTHRQPPQWRKFPDQQETKRQHPGAAGQRPAKRSYVSPLDHNHATKSNSEAKQIKHSETVNFGFGATPASLVTLTSQSTIAKPETFTASSAKPDFSSGFPTSASSFQQNTVEDITSTSTTGSGLAAGFDTSQTNANAFTASPSSSGNVFAASSLPVPSLFAQTQTSNPVFSSGFQMNNSSTLDSSTSNTSSGILSNLVSTVKEQSSGNLTFSGFRNVGASSFTEVSSSNIFGAKIESETVKSSTSTSLTFGKSATPSLQVKSTADSKPLFVGTSQSTSNTFGVAKTVKPQTRIFGHSLTAVKEQRLAKENKEQVAEDKLQNVDISNLTALVIKDIPETYNKNAWLKRFYSRFGEVSKVLCSAVKKSATVTFKTHEAAELAKKRGRILRPGLPPVTIFWKQQGSRRRTTSESEQQIPQSPDVHKSLDKRHSSPEKVKKTSTQTAPSEKQTQQRIKTSEVARDIQEYLKSVPASESAGEKLQVLEGIDKKLRLVFKRTSDISSAKAVVGTCKDMCPEKERYMREHQRRLSVFEAVSGTGSFDENPQVDHTRAVKEYDRSAADKEEPLPHELRPVPVLRMTMDYLATNIMDLCEGREGEWFDFLWNRTRGIRKDITQQHLCDPDCVDLVEKTARFHIFCAHFLCEADMNSFDAKINTENLTKCLQTLKQFYGDLLKDKRVTCPHEAEFRAYDILLNLNEGDILREVMTFRNEVQQSPEVRFAMAVFHALNSYNFVRFFRLLRNANYLSACLLHRYFTQVRSKAVQTLNHSLSVPNRTTPFQLKELVDILAFENESEADEFCTFHGLTVTGSFVNFARSSFIEPESRLPAKRAWKLIESKRSCSIGEVVYNGPLPTAPQHQPDLSFSEDGRYIADLTELLSGHLHDSALPSQADVQNQPKPTCNATESSQLVRLLVSDSTSGRQVSMESPGALSVQLGVDTGQGPSAQIQPTQIEPAKAAVSYSGEEILNFTKRLFVEVMNEMCTEITKEAMDKVHVDLRLSTEITNTLHEETISKFIRETADSVLTEELDRKRIVEENAVIRERVLRNINDDFTEEFISLECTRIVEEVIREVRLELLELARERVSKEICQSLIEEKISNELEEIAEEVLQEAKAERDAKLQLLAGYVKRSRTAKYFKRWLKAFRASVHLKELLGTFPPGPPMVNIDNQLQHLVGHRKRDITMAVLRSDAHESEIHDAMKKRQAAVEYNRKEACRPLDVPLLLADSMRCQPDAQRLVSSSPVYWKLILALPEVRDGLEFATGDDGNGLDICYIIKEKFKRGLYPVSDNIPQGLRRKIDLLALYGAEVRGIPLQKRLLKICTKACYGVLTNTEVREAMDTRQFFGSCAVIFVVDGKELKRNPEAPREAHIRLRRVLESKPPEPRLPVAVIAIDNDEHSSTEGDVLSHLGVQQLRTEGLLSEYKLCTVSSLPGHRDDLSLKLCSAVTWVGSHMARCSLPRTDNIINFIENGLQRFFTTPLAEDVFIRRQAKLEQQCPEAIVELYNSALEHLGAVASSRSLQNMSWPIKEFSDKENREHDIPDVTWNSYENLQRINTLIISLKLPPPPPAAVDGTWESESNLCREYARSLQPNTASLLNRVKWILARTQRALNGIDLPLANPWLSASQVPWPLVLDACVNFRLTPLHSDPGVEEQDVYFLPEELDAFYPPSLWTQSVNLSKEEAVKAKSESSLESSKPRKTRDTVLHESFMDMEQQFHEITGSSPSLAIPSEQPTPPITSSYISVPSVTPLLVTPALVAPIPPASSVDIASPSSSSRSEIRITSEQLKSAVDQAKTESKRFEELLKSALTDGESPRGLGDSSWRKRKAQSLGESKKSPKFLEGINLPNFDVSFGSLEGNLLHFNETLKSQRRSDKFTERRLREYLDS